MARSSMAHRDNDREHLFNNAFDRWFNHPELNMPEQFKTAPHAKAGWISSSTLPCDETASSICRCSCRVVTPYFGLIISFTHSAPNGEFRVSDQAGLACPVPARQIFLFLFSRIYGLNSRIPPRHEGRFAIVTIRGAGCGGRAGPKHE